MTVRGKILSGLLLILAAFLFVPFQAYGQELKCRVEVNAEQSDYANKDVFAVLQQAITDYINDRQWSKLQFAPNERIDCGFMLTIKEYDGQRMKGDLQISVSRPVFDSSYSTTLFNYKDARVEFDYRDGDQLIFNEQTSESELTDILDFYVYMILGIDADSFSRNGGQQFFDRAMQILLRAQNSGSGWRAFDDPRSRGSLLGVFTDSNTSEIRSLYYIYHRLGLDRMAASPDKGRAEITNSLPMLEEIGKKAPMSISATIFRDAKLDELVNIYSKAPEQERVSVAKLLEKIYPTDSERIEKIKNPEK